MANVRGFEPKDTAGPKPHSDVDATIAVVEVDGEKFIQIDTYGSSDRLMPGKVSQSLRLSEAAFDQLVKIGKDFF